jgi:hypothetical protein
MKRKAFERTAQTIGVLVLVISISALAQNSTHKMFRGVINAYSPQTTTTVGTTTTTTGPYEIRGPWSLKLKGDSGKADFSAELNMELSDGWVLTENNKNFDPSARGAHTHHITIVDGDVTPITNPNGFRVTGPATITLNGTFAPISPSQLVIEITGGTDVEFSNITLTFQPPASKHFGAEPLPGVVRSVKAQLRTREP